MNPKGFFYKLHSIRYYKFRAAVTFVQVDRLIEKPDDQIMTIADYNQIVDTWADAIYRYALKFLGGASSAQDIVQDCFEKLWIHRDQIDPAKIKSWLFTTAHHTMIDGIRKAQRERIPESGKLPEEVYEEGYSDLQEILGQAIEKLPEVQKSVVLLRDYEGYSYQEIGEITGLSEAQVKVYIYRARIFLKNYIGSLEAVL